MGVGVRIFFVHDGQAKPFPSRKFESIVLRQDTSIQLSQYAGKCVKYVMVFTENENCRPIGIRNIDFGYLNIDKDGRVDISWINEKTLDAVETVAATVILPEDMGEDVGNVINAVGSFIRRRNLAKYHWTPTKEELRQMLQLIFKTDLGK